MGKHLSLSDRVLIERFLVNDFSFAHISRKLDRSPSSISREVRNKRVFVIRDFSKRNDCVEYSHCLRNTLCLAGPSFSCFSRCKMCADHDCRTSCPSYISTHCEALDKPPYVCTPCRKQQKCTKNHAYYTAHRAHAEYLKELRQSRKGLHASPEQLVEIGDLISPLILKGQSLNHIFSTHADEIGFSKRTIYNYIDSNAFLVRNIDLPKKVRYKPRRSHNVLTRMEYRYRKGRSYEDFTSYLEAHPDTRVVEMDTVVGTRCKGKVLLTMIFRESNFMLIFLMSDNTRKSVEAVFDHLYSILGLATFRKIFPIILTDNGGEFKDPTSLEHAPNGAQRTRVFYCDPQASWQKPHVEKNHVLIRRILPKGTSFSLLSQKDIHLVTCHINSVARELFQNKTPFDLCNGKEHKKMLESLSLVPVPPDEVCLKPALLKKKE